LKCSYWKNQTPKRSNSTKQASLLTDEICFGAGHTIACRPKLKEIELPDCQGTASPT